MNRRGFLGAMLGAVAGATLDPERLLWVPGRKVYSVPSDLFLLNTGQFRMDYMRPAAMAIIDGMNAEFAKFYSEQFDKVHGLRAYAYKEDGPVLYKLEAEFKPAVFLQSFDYEIL